MCSLYLIIRIDGINVSPVTSFRICRCFWKQLVNKIAIFIRLNQYWNATQEVEPVKRIEGLCRRGEGPGLTGHCPCRLPQWQSVSQSCLSQGIIGAWTWRHLSHPDQSPVNKALRRPREWRNSRDFVTSVDFFLLVFTLTFCSVNVRVYGGAACVWRTTKREFIVFSYYLLRKII